MARITQNGITPGITPYFHCGPSIRKCTGYKELLKNYSQTEIFINIGNYQNVERPETTGNYLKRTTMNKKRPETTYNEQETT